MIPTHLIFILCVLLAVVGAVLRPRWWLYVGLFVIAAVLPVALLIASAQASPVAPDDQDQQFLNMLTARGVTFNSNDIISYAHGLCIEMQDDTYPQVVSNILHDYPKLPRKAGEVLTQVSIKYYCPEYTGKIIDEVGVM